jgi:DNA-binding PadR family transcriptional regulator
MQRKGWTESFLGKTDTRPKRKYYPLLLEGLQQLQIQGKQWQQLSSMITQVKK